MEEKQPYTPATAGAVGQPTTEPWATPEHAEPVKEGCMRLIAGLKMRAVAGQTLLYPATPEASKKVYQPAILNKEATQLTKWMAEDFTVDSIVQKGLTVYRVDEALLCKDVEKLVDTLCLAGMLEGEEVVKKLKCAATTISGTAVIRQGNLIERYTKNIKRIFGKKSANQKEV